jgi:hypothetical protein
MSPKEHTIVGDDGEVHLLLIYGAHVIPAIFQRSLSRTAKQHFTAATAAITRRFRALKPVGPATSAMIDTCRREQPRHIFPRNLSAV